MDIKKIKELVKIMQKGNLTEIEYEEGESRIKLVKNNGIQNTLPIQQPVQHIQVPQVISTQDTVKTEKTEIKSEEVEYHIIRSPMVGTFYRAPAPDADPYVKEGDTVNPDTIVCIIESMKVMNEIEADVKGKIVEILVENGEPVEYNQPLFYVDTNA